MNVIAQITFNNISPTKVNIERATKNLPQNPFKTLSKECPAIILANNRIAKLTIRAKYDISSINIKPKRIPIWVPGVLKISTNCHNQARNVIKKLATKPLKLQKRVETIKLVAVIEYGISPR